MTLLEALINPHEEELELGERALVCSAANVLQIGEFQRLQLAYANRFGRELPETLVDRLFASCMLHNEVPHWARHFARAVLAEDAAGRLDPDHPAWHRYGYRGSAAGGALRFCAAAGAVGLALVPAVLAAAAAVKAPTALLPPYFERADFPNGAVPAFPARSPSAGTSAGTGW